jgi:hypothetical protein
MALVSSKRLSQNGIAGSWEVGKWLSCFVTSLLGKKIDRQEEVVVNVDVAWVLLVG